MTNKVVAAAAFVALVFCVAHAFADEESHRQAAEELLRVMKMEAGMLKATEMQMEAAGCSPAVVDATVKFHARYLNWEGLKKDIAAIYTERFTEAEIRELARFYGTATGQKVLDAEPAMNAALMKRAAACTREHMDEYGRVMAEAQALDRPPPTPPPTPGEEVEIEGARSQLDALFVISFRDDEVPDGSRAGDVRASVVVTAIRRLKAARIRGLDIVSVGRDSISLRVSTVTVFGGNDIARLLGQAGRLALRLVHPDDDKLVANSQRDPVAFRIPEGYEKCEMQVRRRDEVDTDLLFVQVRPEELDGEDVIQAIVTNGEDNGNVICLTFAAEGTKALRKVTAENVGRRLAIAVDGRTLCAPVVREPVTTGVVEFPVGLDTKEATLLAAALTSGPYPVPVRVEVKK